MEATFAGRFTVARIRKDHTQREAADACGVHSNTVNDWEHGVVPRKARQALADYLGIPLEELINLLKREKEHAA